MIVARAPLRISFAGGGSDLPAYWRRGHVGRVLGMAIDQYVYVAVHRTFDGKFRAVYSQMEEVDDPKDLQNPLTRECLLDSGIKEGVEISSMADVCRGGTGLGSSSAYTVALLAALSGKANAVRLAERAVKVEIDRCKKPIGLQDQYLSALGGIKVLEFMDLDGGVYFHTIHEDWFLKDLMLFHIGTERSSDSILARQGDTIAKSPGFEAVEALTNLVPRLLYSIELLDPTMFGETLDQAWQIKRSLDPAISTPEIDGWYAAARQAGALGGKLLGAGGGGFLLLYCPGGRHDVIREAMMPLREVPFGLDLDGVKIVYNDEERD